MPTLNNPGHYERAEYESAGNADAFLKWLDEADALDVTGSTESPIGHVMLIQIDRGMIRDWVSSAGDPWMSERRNFEPGWYIIRTDDNGLVWGIGYGGYCSEHDDFCGDTLNEEKARADFEEAEAVYAAWFDG